MKIHEILTAEPDRWCQDTFATLLPDGRFAHCVMGWCEFKYPIGPLLLEARLELLRAGGFEFQNEILLWNDATGRTVTEVIELCRKADV